VSVFQAVWLGIVQGLTEFLPISSSAHLILARQIFGWEAGNAEIAFDVACHLGTLAAVVTYFWDDVFKLVVAAPGAIVGRNDEASRAGRRVIASTLPIVLVGLLFEGQLESLREPSIVAFSLAIGGLALLLAEAVGSRQRRAGALSLSEAALLGCAQAVALVPGVSRSGAVITVAVLRGLTREEAARFAFLIGIPAILGAGLRAFLKLGLSGILEFMPVLAVGFVVSGLVGYGAVAVFLRCLARYSLAPFAYYRLVVAGVLLVQLFA